jgi:hypothetical protein
MIGGGSTLSGIENAARTSLHLPSKCPGIKYDTTFKFITEKQAEWVVGYGVGVLGINSEDENTVDIKDGMRLIGKTRGTIWKWIKQFLP